MSGNENILATVENIFPTPVYISNIQRNLTKVEIDFISLLKKKLRTNTFNKSSVNNYILKEKELIYLKKDLESHINNFFYNHLKYNKKAKPYITQSWLNVTKKNEAHHQHEHPNSFLSGVFYIETVKDIDKIKFFDLRHQTISPNVDEFNAYNSKSWWFSTGINDVIIFPSSTSHAVMTKNDDNVRVSIAFNIFVKGDIGDNFALTELKL